MVVRSGDRHGSETAIGLPESVITMRWNQLNGMNRNPHLDPGMAAKPTSPEKSGALYRFHRTPLEIHVWGSRGHSPIPGEHLTRWRVGP